MERYLVILSLLTACCSCYEELDSQKCSRISDCSSCISSVNDEIGLDSSKCLPINPDSSVQFGQTDGLTSSSTCASWRDVQSSSLEIDYSCGQDSLSEEEKQQIADLVQIVEWSDSVRSGHIESSRLLDAKQFENSTLKTRAGMGYDPLYNRIHIVFRGSDNTINWILDFDFFKTEYTVGGCPDCQVHRGFLASYKSLQAEIEPYLAELAAKYPEAQVVVSGHSLGGAEAVVCAMAIADLGYQPDLYTYGQPRVGDKNFVNFFNDFLTGVNLRAVYRNDPVPTVPFVEVLEFYHGGREVHFYACDSQAYVAYPEYTDDAPFIELLQGDDHEGYYCLQMNDASVIAPPVPAEGEFFQ